MKMVSVVAVCAALSGCISDTVKFADNESQVNAVARPLRGGAAAARIRAAEEARDECEDKGKRAALYEAQNGYSFSCK